METTIKDDLSMALNDFYQSYLVDSINGTFQIFQSFTYGEMVISFLLALIVIILLLKWVYEVII